MKGFYLLILFSFAASGITILSVAGNPKWPKPDPFSISDFRGDMAKMVQSQDSVFSLITRDVDKAHSAAVQTIGMAKEIRDKRRKPTRRDLPEASNYSTYPVRFTTKKTD